MQEGPKQILRQHHHVRRHAKHQGPPVKPMETKKGAPVGILVTIGVGGLFLAYAFNAGGMQTALDGILNGANQQVHTNDAAVGAGFVAALPYIGLAMGLAVIYVVLRGMGIGKRKTPRKVEGEALTVHEFAELAGAQGVGAKVAREAYRMLLPEYGEQMRTTLGQSFTGDLGLAPGGCDADVQGAGAAERGCTAGGSCAAGA